jgi:hypothetical protein
MPRVRALRDFISTVHGNVSTGDKFSMDAGKRYETLKALGYVEDVQPDPVFTEGATHAPAPGAQIPEAEEGIAGPPEPVEPESIIAAPALTLHHEGGPWFTVRGGDGQPVHDGKLKKADAEALLAEKAAG